MTLVFCHQFSHKRLYLYATQKDYEVSPDISFYLWLKCNYSGMLISMAFLWGGLWEILPRWETVFSLFIFLYFLGFEPFKQ